MRRSRLVRKHRPPIVPLNRPGNRSRLSAHVELQRIGEVLELLPRRRDEPRLAGFEQLLHAMLVQPMQHIQFGNLWGLERVFASRLLNDPMSPELLVRTAKGSFAIRVMNSVYRLAPISL
jgi:hypothetical protein